MATTTPIQGFPVPEQADTPDVPRDITNLATAVEKRVMGVYATITDRDTRNATPQDGMFAYVQDQNQVYVFQDGVWVEYPQPMPTIYTGTTVPNNADGVDGDIYFQV
jgi:hypothetical protein